MTEEISVEVSDLYAEMYEQVEETAGSEQTRQAVENMIHNLYQQVEQAQQQQQFRIEEPEDRE
ncbi:hypothetical protein M199_gp030 [Halogranum tailed virus 1]|uniref:Uncharacterized protein n=1 Tax=Halogranum tailed virus 1 TaxID=1273749 RepID=R4T8Y5_9CAUD|nr:hypothetical protein M199_gp030 [Halogranum tailed virus 1]AGM11360.1 hypothetical protein HGTV1_30 [Halogranum tailed virus 1]